MKNRMKIACVNGEANYAAIVRVTPLTNYDSCWDNVGHLDTAETHDFLPRLKFERWAAQNRDDENKTAQGLAKKLNSLDTYR